MKDLIGGLKPTLPLAKAHPAFGKKEKNGGKMQDNRQLLKKAAEIYNWLDLQIHNHTNLAGVCRACGKCCDFAQLDHRLFVTTPELVHLVSNLGAENIKSMTTSRCPYHLNGKCTIYKYRFASCRIFCCKGDANFQSRLSESVLKKFKSLCTDFHVSYHYTDLATALNSMAESKDAKAFPKTLNGKCGGRVP